MGIHRTEIAGVPTIWAPADGELRAGLVFRVGRADETLARAGITHLLEHLVLHGIERPDLHFNGATSPLVTTFAVHGGADEVRDFFTTICRGLRELPADRLAKEVDVLRTEAAGRGQGFIAPLRTWRYGAAGYGLVGYPEFGLNDLTADDLRAWVNRWFTRGNAALWVTGGPPPEGLRLDLPDGPRCAPPVARTVLPRTPAYFAADVDGVAFEAILPRGTASTAYALVLDRRMHLRLRRELGISYTTLVNYDHLDAEHDALTAFADALKDKHAEVAREFVNILTDLVTDAVSEDELATMRSIAQRGIFDPAGLTERTHGHAQSLLLDRPLREPEDIWDNVRAISAEDVSGIARQALDTGLAMVPHGQAVGRAGFVAAPTGSDTAVDGTEHRPRNRPEGRERLIVGREGVSLVNGLEIATVRYDQCAAMLAWPDGARVLFAEDAVNVRIEPQLWHVPARLIADIDARVPAERVAHLRARADDAIPQPPDPPEAAARPAEPRAGTAGRRRSQANLYILLGSIFVLLVMVILLGTTSGAQSAAPVGIALFWLSLGAGARYLRASRAARGRDRSR